MSERLNKRMWDKAHRSFLATPAQEPAAHDFSGLSDLDLVQMQKELREVPEDKDFLHAILVELGNRQKTHDLNDEEKAKRKNTT